jgi:hypothetical protein
MRLTVVPAATPNEPEVENPESEDDQEESPEILPGEGWNEDGYSQHNEYDANYDSS